MRCVAPWAASRSTTAEEIARARAETQEAAVRVIVRTPAELVAEYDLPEVDSDSSDEDVLAAVAAAEPLRHGEPEVVGETYVFARGLESLAEQGRRLEQAEARLAAERLAAAELARKYRDKRSKRDLATTLGITRPTLDSWLGDAPPRRRSSGA
ncbi:hypothetical protein [Mycolicibacterium komossense]|uniref:Uncharacterized protein n=1 Tax=Mycolicibacterium komossense TaxID=1779 RepID=A0ABT3C7R3_9MYCO|nr:hypothetical protein [Mycolicibacterium komossense]MCV7225271.1 hypothetical protein [Mycolicibacterium komossense]